MSSDKQDKKTMIPVHQLPVEDRKLNFNEVHHGYLTLDEVMAESQRCIQCPKPKCQEACPAHCKIPDFFHHLQEGRTNETMKLIYQFYAFPGSLHRICPALCMQNCVIGKRGDSVNIFDIVRYMVDNYPRDEAWYSVNGETGKKVAVIGAGPAGLTAAYFLRKKGHEVTVYEKLSVPGGMLAVGIPEYRLKNEYLFKEVEEMEKTGVKFVYNKAYGPEFNHTHLKEMGYNAILITHGAHKPKWMGIPGEDLEGNMHAVDYLREVGLGNPPQLGKKVAVIGGGDVAIDAVRVSTRYGCESFIVYRRSIEEMPATKSEIHETQVENIPIHFLTNPVKIIGDENGKVKAIELIKMELGEPDDSGRRRPVEVPGSEYIMEVDNVIQAISQKPSTEDIDAGKEFKMTRWDTFDVEGAKYPNMTNIDGVFAAGDDVTGPYLAITAIADAHNAVRGIHEFLTGEKIEPQPEVTRPISKPPKN
ncbi:MAG: NAD(P)-dependent oxidoreductase [Candidatus Heimdallarchaeota archaeon]|nr:NAD(P)-dependent oxidoreductase [Candidatus Heimdallarchaeota archaeon]